MFTSEGYDHYGDWKNLFPISTLSYGTISEDNNGEYTFTADS